MSSKWWRGVYTGVLEALAGDRVLRSLLGIDVVVATFCAVAALALGRQQRTVVLLIVGSTLVAGALLTWVSLSIRRYSPALLLSVMMMAALVNGLFNVVLLGCECEPPQCRGLELFAHWAVPPPLAEKAEAQVRVPEVPALTAALSFIQMGQSHSMTQLSAPSLDPTEPPARPAEAEPLEVAAADVAVEVDAQADARQRVETRVDSTEASSSMAESAGEDLEVEVEEEKPPLTRRVEQQAGTFVAMLQDAHAAGPPQAARLLCTMLRAVLVAVLGVHTGVLVLRSHALYTLVKKVKDASLAEARVGILADILAPDTKTLEELSSSSDTDHDPPGQDRRSESDGVGETLDALDQWRARDREASPGGGAGAGDEPGGCD